MRPVVPVLCVGLLVASPSPQQPLFRSGVRTVVVYATVSDGSGRLVPDLGRDDFRVFDQGRPVDLTTFSNDPQPITVAVMLDMSGSMEGRVLTLRDATLRFIDSLVPGDRACIGSFGQEVAVSPLLTGHKATLRRVVSEELWPGGGTPMWNAVDAAISSLEPQTGRRVVLVFTDGFDTGSLPGLTARHGVVARRARDGGFMVYAIGTKPRGLTGDIVGLTEDTGGGHFELTDDDDLAATFDRVAEELRHQYVLGFTPAVLDGKVHKLDVRLARRGLKARARKSYLAARE